MNLEWYYTFLILAKHLNYRKASEECFLTQPSVYKQIKRLEEHLNTTLFENVGRGIQLTNSGKSLIPIAMNLTRFYENAMQEIKEEIISETKKLNIVICSYIASYLMPSFLPILFKEEPRLNVTLTVLDDDVINQIEDGKFDIAITREPPINSKVYHEKICEGKIKLIVPNNKDNLSHLDEKYYLENYKVFVNDQFRYWKDIKLKIKKITENSHFIEIKDTKVCETLIKSNEGISYLPIYLLSKDDNNQLKAIEPSLIESPISHTYIVYLRKNPSIILFNTLFKKFIEKEKTKNFNKIIRFVQIVYPN